MCSTVPTTGHGVIAAGLEELGQEPDSSTPVLIHDVRHPLVPAEVIDRVVAALAAGHRIVVPVLPVTDTVKSVDERGVVTATVDRATLLTVQYPRGFVCSTLSELIVDGATDELQAALAAGLPVETVDGHADAVRFDVACGRGPARGGHRESSLTLSCSSRCRRGTSGGYVTFRFVAVPAKTRTSTSAKRSTHDDVSVPSKPSASARR